MANNYTAKAKYNMNINLTEIPSPSKLIATMDKQRFGAAMFVISLLISFAGAVALTWVYLYFKH